MNRDEAEVHENDLALFVLSQHRARFRDSLAGAKRRKKFLLQDLGHFKYLDPRFAHSVPKRQQSASLLRELLKGKGAPDLCYVVSTDPELDGREVPLGEALERIVGITEGFASCIPGRLAYFEGEDRGMRYLLKRD